MIYLNIVESWIFVSSKLLSWNTVIGSKVVQKAEYTFLFPFFAVARTWRRIKLCVGWCSF